MKRPELLHSLSGAAVGLQQWIAQCACIWVSCGRCAPYPALL